MSSTKITVQAKVLTDRHKVWDYYMNPKHIVNWNFADSSWHCPAAENDLKVGGEYCARMEAKDGSFGFDFKAIYDEVKVGESFAYTLEDGRKVAGDFRDDNRSTILTLTFDAEDQNSIEMQRSGWQVILNNFKKYVENN
ncbi:MAG: activator of HSP90 ATPase [Flavobacteriales bacterium]|nr:activator of HSP90 ATPase [Flavobacteriales bacterium]|tara:strand:+ start:5439 stop:5855 length:417 start_codon:yes stop_codon:yes gene_type:complete